MTLGFWKDMIAVLRGAVETAAILAGGVWAYYKFLRMRTFKARLSLGMSGEALHHAEGLYLSVILEAKNIGSTRVRLEPDSAGLRIFAMKGLSPSNEVARGEWERLATYPLLEGEEWIEPGETLQDTLLITLPTTLALPVRLEGMIVCQGSRWLKMTNCTRKLVGRDQLPSSLRWTSILIVFKKGGETPNAGNIEASRR